MEGTIPAYLYDKNNNIKTIIFTALFALLFINLFQPFGSRDWYPGISDITYFAFSSLIILTGMMVVVISRIILTICSKKRELLYWHYALWILCEIVAMAIFYTLFARFFPKMESKETFRNFQTEHDQHSFGVAVTYSFLAFFWKEKIRLLEHIEQLKNQEVKAKIAFPDEKGDLRSPSCWINYYIESATVRPFIT